MQPDASPNLDLGKYQVVQPGLSDTILERMRLQIVKLFNGLKSKSVVWITSKYQSLFDDFAIHWKHKHIQASQRSLTSIEDNVIGPQQPYVSTSSSIEDEAFAYIGDVDLVQSSESSYAVPWTQSTDMDTDIFSPSDQSDVNVAGQGDGNVSGQGDVNDSAQVDVNVSAQVDVNDSAQVDVNDSAQVDVNDSAQVDVNVSAQGDGNVAAKVDGNVAAQGDGNVAAQGDVNVAAKVDGNVTPTQGDGNVAAQGSETISAQVNRQPASTKQFQDILELDQDPKVFVAKTKLLLNYWTTTLTSLKKAGDAACKKMRLIDSDVHFNMIDLSETIELRLLRLKEELNHETIDWSQHQLRICRWELKNFLRIINEIRK